MARNPFPFDLFKAAKTDLLESFSDNLGHYEEKLWEFLEDLDLKSRPARARGKKKISEATRHLKQTRKEVEKRMLEVLVREGEKFNLKISDLVHQLQSIALADTTTKAPGQRAAKKKVSSSKNTASTLKKKKPATRVKANATNVKSSKAPRRTTSGELEPSLPANS